MIYHDPAVGITIGSAVTLLGAGVNCFFNTRLKRRKLNGVIFLAGSVIMGVMAFIQKNQLLPEETFLNLYIAAIAVIVLPLLVLWFFTHFED